jgi:hypothetical protein
MVCAGLMVLSVVCSGAGRPQLPVALNRQLSVQGPAAPEAALEVDRMLDQPAAIDVYNHGQDYLMRFFTPDPVKGNVLRTYINDGGAVYSNAWMVISGGLSDYTIATPQVLHPTGDTFMLGIWSDVNGPAMVVRPSLTEGEPTIATTDAGGNYRLAILPDGSMVFSDAVSSEYASSAWDTVLHRVGPGHLRTDGNFSAAAIIDTPNLITLLNNSSSTVTPGTVLVIDTTQDAAFVPSQAQADTKVIGVASEPIAAGTSGLVATGGVARVNVKGPVARGDLLITSGASGIAQSVGAKKPMPGSIIGKALSATTNSFDQIQALIML